MANLLCNFCFLLIYQNKNMSYNLIKKMHNSHAFTGMFVCIHIKEREKKGEEHRVKSAFICPEMIHSHSMSICNATIIPN